MGSLSNNATVKGQGNFLYAPHPTTGGLLQSSSTQEPYFPLSPQEEPRLQTERKALLQALWGKTSPWEP